MTVDELIQTIQAAIPGATVYAANPQNDGQHYEAIVVSDSFEGQPMVRQHQRVMNALKQAFETSVHALQLRTFTPSQWDHEKSSYNV